MTRGFYGAAVGNSVAFWRHEDIAIELVSGIDEIGLGLSADAWSRTYRSKAVTVSSSTMPVLSRHGLRIIPDRTAANPMVGAIVRPIPLSAPVKSLELTLAEIASRYGQRTRAFVALQLEYPQYRGGNQPERQAQ